MSTARAGRVEGYLVVGLAQETVEKRTVALYARRVEVFVIGNTATKRFFAIRTDRDSERRTRNHQNFRECFQRISMVLADSLRSVQVVKGEMKRVC